MDITEVIYMVILLAVGFGMGWLYAKAHTMDDYNHMYSHLTCEIISRMQQAMRSMRMEQEDIDLVIERMGCKLMPASVAPPPPAEKKELKKIEQKPAMIQWKGDNLKEVVDFTGVYKEGFEKWFHNSWEEYEKYVHEHNNIFKIFNEDGSHMEVPVGAWIIKVPDGYNTASRYGFVPKPPEWSEEDDTYSDLVITAIKLYYTDDKGEENPWREELLRWLKSLKDRYTWKPSGGQMKALKEACDEHWEPDGLDPLYTLYQDLKKLREG